MSLAGGRVRSIEDVEEGKVDGAITINENSGIKNVFYTDSHITYQNVAITLQSRNYQIDKVSGLGAYKVLAFQNAIKYLGDEFAKMAENNDKYKETAKQEKQIPLLFLDRTQALVLDINIFKYFRREEKSVDTSSAVSIHEVFPPSHYKMAFLNKDIRDDFNAGLILLKSSGKYENIISRYIQ